jgi:hypothetical protein
VPDVAVVVIVVVAVAMAVRMLRRSHGLVAQRGMSVGADLGTMRDAPQVRVTAVTKEGPGRVGLRLTPVDTSRPVLEYVVDLGDDEFGFGLLQKWQQAGSALALVLPPGSQLVRLRSIDDLQPITLRRSAGEDGPVTGSTPPADSR